MKSLWKNEMKRMLCEKEFWITMILGCGIAVWHFVQHVYNAEMFALDVPDNAYVCWMGANAYRMQSYWYYMIFPLLAVLPCVGGWYDDYHSGYVKSVLLKCDRKSYFTVKGMIVFLSGGLGVVIPLLLNFLLTATKRPMLYPDPFVAIGPQSYCLGSEFYYMYPLLYTLLYLMFDFAIGGFIAVGAMLLSVYVNYKFVALVIPYGLFYFLNCLGAILGTNIFTPNIFLIPGIGIESVVSLVMMAAFALLAILAYVWKGRTYEG